MPHSSVSVDAESLAIRALTDRRWGMSIFLRWFTLTHTMRYPAHYHTAGEGHVYQGRFKSFPVQDNGHLHVLCRHVERNAQRAELVERAEDWRWGVSVPLGSAERTFATAIVAVAVGAFGQLDSPRQRGARRQATRCASLVDPAWQSVRCRELGGVDRPSTGPRIDAMSTRTPEKEAHFNRPTKQGVLTALIWSKFSLLDKSDKIDVTVEKGTVILRGEVATWRQWQVVMELALASGARHPHNLLNVR